MKRNVGRPKGLGKGLPFGASVPFEDRVKTFWSLVDKNGPTPVHRPELANCWSWLGGTNQLKNKDSYGRLNVSGKMILCHRFSWYLEFGKQPEKPYLCHKCDNTLCVRPSHLFEGTALDNNQDASRKGRMRSWGRPILTPKKVLSIRHLYQTGNFTYETLAAFVGEPRTRIQSALNKWKTLNQYAAFNKPK